MSKFNIRNIIDSVSKNGVMPTNKFYVSFSSPRILGGAQIGTAGLPIIGNATERLIQLRADSAKIPGVLLVTSDTFRYGIGPAQKMPYNASFTEVGVNLILDKNGEIYNYFYAWMSGIFDFTGAAVPGQINTDPSYETQYKNNYTTDVQITIVDAYDENSMVYTLKKAFPISISDINLDWNQQNTLAKLHVNFSFRDWSLERVKLTTNRPSSPNVETRPLATSGASADFSNFTGPR